MSDQKSQTATAFAAQLVPDDGSIDPHWALSAREFVKATYLFVGEQRPDDIAAQCRAALAGPIETLLEAMQGSADPEVQRIASKLLVLSSRERASFHSMVVQAVHRA